MLYLVGSFTSGVIVVVCSEECCISLVITPNSDATVYRHTLDYTCASLQQGEK